MSKGALGELVRASLPKFRRLAKDLPKKDGQDVGALLKQRLKILES